MSEPAAVTTEGNAIRTELAATNVGSARHAELTQRLEQVYRTAHRQPAAASPPAPPVPGVIPSEPPRLDEPPPSVAVAPGMDPRIPEAPASEAIPGFAPPPGVELDPSAVTALRSLEISHDVPLSELTTLAGEYLASRERRAMDPETRLAARDAVLGRAWGDDADLWFTRGLQVIQTLPVRLRDHIAESTMLRDAPVWLALAAAWERNSR